MTIHNLRIGIPKKTKGRPLAESVTSFQTREISVVSPYLLDTPKGDGPFLTPTG